MPLDDDDDTYDVISDHHKRNRMPKPPSLDRLRHSLTHQRRWPKRILEEDEDEIVPDSEEEPEDEDSQSDNNEEPARKRIKRNSTPRDAKPTQLRFYPGTWQDVLERAKQLYRLWAVEECPFPERECHLLNALKCLEAAMEEFEQKGREVEAGTCKCAFLCHILINAHRLFRGVCPRYASSR